MCVYVSGVAGHTRCRKVALTLIERGDGELKGRSSKQPQKRAACWLLLHTTGWPVSCKQPTAPTMSKGIWDCRRCSSLCTMGGVRARNSCECQCTWATLGRRTTAWHARHARHAQHALPAITRTQCAVVQKRGLGVYKQCPRLPPPPGQAKEKHQQCAQGSGARNLLAAQNPAHNQLHLLPTPS